MEKKVSKDSSKKKSKKPQETTEIWIKKQVYGESPKEQHFILKDGKELKDLKELTESLHIMQDNLFFHHVNSSRNDFSNWINDVFDEKDLAEEMKKMHSRMEAELALHRHFDKKLNSIIKKIARKKNE